jgi:predicted nucleic acid-binding protein
VKRSTRGLVDTSVFIASESGRSLDEGRLPEESAISVITLAELQAGVLVACDTTSRARRLATLGLVADIEILPVDEPVALEWARLRTALLGSRRRVNVNDSWVAATAIVHDLPVVTQDADFDVLADVAGLDVIRV